MYKYSYRKRLSKKMSDRAKAGWKIRRLRMEANPREERFEEIVARAKQDRKGKHYATWTRKGVMMKMYHSLNRSDQYDIELTLEGEQTITHYIKNLSAPKALVLFQNPV